MKKIIILTLLFLNLCGILYSEEYTAKEICSVIWIIEGKEKANQYYGINPKYIKCYSKQECEQICINTVNHKYKDWQKQTKEQYFLTYLAKKYCPFNWKVWLKNLNYYLKGECNEFSLL